MPARPCIAVVRALTGLQPSLPGGGLPSGAGAGYGVLCFTAPARARQFVYDLATATAVYRNRISPDPIFLTAASPSTGGFYAINRRAPCPELLQMLNSHCLLCERARPPSGVHNEVCI